MFRAGDVRIESVPDASIIEPTDAVVTVTRACICGSDLWPYQKMDQSENGRLIGHEAIGIFEPLVPTFARQGRWVAGCFGEGRHPAEAD